MSSHTSCLFSEPVHSQSEDKNIPYPSLAVSTSIAELVVSVHEIKIHSDSVPTSKQEARKMTRNPSDIQKTEKLVLCRAILPPS